jgi:iron(II)-dependent oxidoreductase
VRSRLLRLPADEAGAQLDAVAHQLARARARTDALFGLVPESLLFERPIAERHRIAFYLGHLEAFDVNLLLRLPGARLTDTLDRLFAFGIDPINGDLPRDRPQDWPAPDELRAYARQARARVDAWLEELGRVRPQAEDVVRLLAALEHRWMHAETLAYLLNRLPVDRPIRKLPAVHRTLGDDDMLTIPAGTAAMGHAGDGFGWDNEFCAHTVAVPAFRIDRYMVTNAQLLRFLEAGGYREPRYWTEIDWHWRESQNVEHPAAWVRSGGEWLLQSRADAIPFQADWPAYVSHAEASAYARWAGKRLPSEAQWQRAAYGEVTQRDPEPGNFDFKRWDPQPVDAQPRGASAFGVIGMLGNGWEWTHSAFAPFPGFRAQAFYLGYSADFFDDRHFVLKGGSAHTAARLLRPSFRNWFQPHYPHVFAGFRCVSDA